MPCTNCKAFALHFAKMHVFPPLPGLLSRSSPRNISLPVTQAPGADGGGAQPQQLDDIVALRALVFDAIRAVRAGTLDTDRARAINSLAATVIDSGRAQLEHARTL